MTPTMWVTLPSHKGSRFHTKNTKQNKKKPLKATTEGVVNRVRYENSVVVMLKMSIFLKRCTPNIKG